MLKKLGVISVDLFTNLQKKNGLPFSLPDSEFGLLILRNP